MLNIGSVIKYHNRQFTVCKILYGRKWVTLYLVNKAGTLSTLKYRFNGYEPFKVVGEDKKGQEEGRQRHEAIDEQRREAGFKRRDNWQELLHANKEILESGRAINALVRYKNIGIRPRQLFRITESGCYIKERDSLPPRYISGRFIQGFEVVQ